MDKRFEKITYQPFCFAQVVIEDGAVVIARIGGRQATKQQVYEQLDALAELVKQKQNKPASTEAEHGVDDKSIETLKEDYSEPSQDEGLQGDKSTTEPINRKVDERYMELLNAINEVLFKDLGFHGAEGAAYHTQETSFIDVVSTLSSLFTFNLQLSVSSLISWFK